MPGSVHPKRPTRLPRARLLAAVAAAAVGLAACGGGSSSPHVASLGKSSGTGSGNASGSSATTPATGNASSGSKAPRGNPTALVNEWATCMHGHGDPNQVDPTVDAYGVINITIPADAQDLSGAVHGGTDPCNQYVAAAQRALRAANPVSPPPDQAELVKYVNCMRANGVPKYPYPTGNTTNFNGTGVDPTSPFVLNANKVCGNKLGLPAWWVSGTGPPGDVVVGSGGPNGGPPPSGARPVPGGNGGPRPVPGGSGGAGATPGPAVPSAGG